MGFLGWLQLLFIALKLTSFIDWSWALVFVPAYIWIVLVLLVALIAVISNEPRRPRKW